MRPGRTMAMYWSEVRTLVPMQAATSDATRPVTDRAARSPARSMRSSTPALSITPPKASAATISQTRAQHEAMPPRVSRSSTAGTPVVDDIARGERGPDSLQQGEAVRQVAGSGEGHDARGLHEDGQHSARDGAEEDRHEGRPAQERQRQHQHQGQEGQEARRRSCLRCPPSSRWHRSRWACRAARRSPARSAASAPRSRAISRMWS